MSTAPPGANGTRRCTGRVGKASWAGAMAIEARSKTNAANSLSGRVIAYLHLEQGL
jgi:hypothetical protein